MPNVNYDDGVKITRYYGYNYNGAKAWQTSNGVGRAQRVKRVRIGSKYPFSTFKAYRKSGVIPTQNLYDLQERIQNPSNPRIRFAGRAYLPDGPWMSFFDEGPWGLYWDGSLPGIPTSDAWFTNLRASATQKAKLKAQDMKINVGQFLAEFKQTRKLISETAVSIAKAMLHVRHGRPDLALQELTLRLQHRKLSLSEWRMGVKLKALKPFKNPGSQITKRVSESWLALRFGWIPLVDDVTSAAELLAQHMVGRPIRITVKASEIGDFESVKSGTFYDYTGSPSYTERMWTQAKAQTGYLLEITNPDLSKLAQTGINNLLSVAWELTPYSWLVDYLWKVGDYLQALTAFNGLTIRDRWSSLQVTRQGVVEYRTSNNVVGVNGAKTQWSQRLYQRFNSVVDPVFHIRRGSGLNLTRFGNCVALVALAFGRRPPRSNPYLTQSLIYSGKIG